MREVYKPIRKAGTARKIARQAARKGLRVRKNVVLHKERRGWFPAIGILSIVGLVMMLATRFASAQERVAKTFVENATTTQGFPFNNFNNNLGVFEKVGMLVVFFVAMAAIRYAMYLKKSVRRRDANGPKAMVDMAGIIFEAAQVYLAGQGRKVMQGVFVVAIAMAGLTFFTEVPHGWNTPLGIVELAIGRFLGVVVAGVMSAMVGREGMRVTLIANLRVAVAAMKLDYSEANEIAIRAGAYTGMLCDGLGLLGGATILLVFGDAFEFVLMSFGLGGTLVAMFMRVGGGIFTKAADVAADLVGKLEKGLDEDDPRNAATIADNVGDNVGDCAGMSADVFESYEVTMVAVMVLARPIVFPDANPYTSLIFPLIMRSVGVISSMIGTYSVSLIERHFPGCKGNAEKAMVLAYDLSSFITTGFGWLFAIFYCHDWRMGVMTMVGVWGNVAVNRVTSKYTRVPTRELHIKVANGWVLSTMNAFARLGKVPIVKNVITRLGLEARISPVEEIAEGAHSGHAVLVLYGLTTGMMSIFSVTVVLCGIIGLSAFLFHDNGPEWIYYGVAIATAAYMSHAGNLLSNDVFGPTTDNAQSLGETGNLSPEAKKILTKLDAIGNTKKAETKGVGIGSAVLAAVSLFAAFIENVKNVDPAFKGAIDIGSATGFIGLLLGMMVGWNISGQLIKAVIRATVPLVKIGRSEINDPDVWAFKRPPEFRKCIAICTRAAQKELFVVGLQAIAWPIFVGFLLGPVPLGTFLAGFISTSLGLALFMSNSGGAMDNAKKLVEDAGLKGTEPHKASITGDTIGDPLKDTAGPALNPLIKVMNMLVIPIVTFVVSASLGHYGMWRWVVVGITGAAILWGMRQGSRPAEKIEPAKNHDGVSNQSDD